MLSTSLPSFISTLSRETTADPRDHTIDPCDDLHAHDDPPYNDPRPDAHDDAIDTPSAGALVRKFRAVLSESENKLKVCQLLTERLVSDYLRHQGHLSLLFHSFHEVMKETCPNYNKSCDSEVYKEFQSLVKKGDAFKKRQIVPLNKARENWGRDKVEHYGWVFESEKFCRALGPSQKHSWEKAVDMLNQFISRRARKGRVKDSANPLETVDLNDLCQWDGKGPFNKTGAKGDTLYFVKYAKLSTADVPDGYRLDQYGLLVLGKYGCADLPEPGPEPPSPEPLSEPASEPLSEPLSEPASEPSPEPLSEPSPEPSPEPLSEPLSEPSPEPSPGSSPEPSPGSSPEPSPGSSPEQSPGSSPEQSPTSSPTSQQSTPSSRCSTPLDVPDACPAPPGNSSDDISVEARVGVRRSERKPQQLTTVYRGATRRDTRNPPLNKDQTQRMCSCGPRELLAAIDHCIYKANDEAILRKYCKQQESLCQEHLKKYAIWSTNVGMYLDQKATPATARIMDEFFANPYPHQSQSKKRRRSLPDEAELHDFKRRLKPTLASFNSSGFDDCIGQAAIAFKDEVLHELRSRCPKPGTWEKQNNESMIRLLERAQTPLTVGDDHEIEAYILPESDAEAYLQPNVTLHGPIITEGQQPFQWDKNKGRPIEQLFERICNLDRVVSVQDPSRRTNQSSSKQLTLAEVRRFMLDNSSETRGLNVLEMRNPIFHNTYPRFLSGEDCQLLDHIRDVVLDSATAQRIEATGNDWIKWKDDSIFTLLAQGGAQTLLHRDSGAKGTWLTVQEGLFGFGWLSRPTKQEIREWSADPVSFCGGRLRYAVLGPGRSLFFPLGTIHYVFRLQGTPTLVFGGHVMRWSDILRWMDLLREQLEAPNTSNEDLSPETTRTYVDAVAQLIYDRVKRGWSDDITNKFNSRKKDLYDYLAKSSHRGAGRSGRKH